MNLFQELPSDCNLLIIGFLDVKSVFRSSSTCRNWLDITKHLQNFHPIDFAASFSTYNDSIEYDIVHTDQIISFLSRMDPLAIQSITLENLFLYKYGSQMHDFLNNATNVTYISLLQTLIRPTEFELIGSWTKLKALSLSNAHIDEDVLINTLTKLKNIESFQFTNGRYLKPNYEISDVLKSFSKMTELILNREQTLGDTYKQIGLMTALKRLKLSNCNLGDDVLKYFSALNNLTALEIIKSGTKNSEDRFGLFRGTERIPKVEFLGYGLTHLRNLSKLVHLKGQYDNTIIPNINHIISEYFTQLQSLDMLDQPITAETLTNLPNLTRLSIKGNNDICDTLTRLKHVDVHLTDSSTDDQMTLDQFKHQHNMPYLHTLIYYDANGNKTAVNSPDPQSQQLTMKKCKY